MLSDNIKNLRKKNNMSQDNLAERLGVSRQSISLWETGQTQPTIDNIIALAKIFNVSSDILLGDSDNINVSQDKMSEDKTPEGKMPEDKKPEDKKPKKTGLIIAIVFAATVIIGIIILAVVLNSNNSEPTGNNNTGSVTAESKPTANAAAGTPTAESKPTGNAAAGTPTAESKPTGNAATGTPTAESKPTGNAATGTPTPESKPTGNAATGTPTAGSKPTAPAYVQFDLFTYCKNFAINKGTLNGDYCMYQQPATKYGGYDNEYFSISYWGDSDMVEFCLHCPLSETQSENFYLRMRGGYYKKYEYLSSKYFRDTGESIRLATGYIDPAVFSDRYPLSCDKYEGDFDGQTAFMEESRVGICDLIKCLKVFVKVEKMECDFSSFDFVNF